MEEKHAAPESIASVTIKPDYPPSEYCASEPPPAYHKGQSSAVQVARIIAVTVVVVSFVLGIFILASAYVTATASCRQLEQELELLSQVADRFEGENEGPLMPEALRGEEPKPTKRENKEQDPPAPKPQIKEIDDNSIDNSGDEEEEKKIHFKLPLQLDFDELAGNLIAKNQKSKMNCIVEKKRAEEIVDHQPKTVSLPFGLNLTTDPRLEKLTGERMVIICESGNMQSSEPKTEKPEPEHEDEEDDSEQDTIMIQPVMIPIPQTQFRTHMPQQMAPQEQPRFQFRPQQQMPHPMEAMRPPMPPMRPPMEQFRPPMEFRQFEQQRPDVQRIIAIRQNFQPQQQQRAEEMEQPQRNSMMFIPQRVQIHVEAQQPPQQPQEQTDSSPNPIIQNIIRQIIAQKIAEAQQEQKQQQEQEQPRPFPIPEEVLTQLNRLPSQDRVIVAVAEPESSEEDSDSESGESQDMTDQKQEQPPQMVQNDNRQAYMRRLPVNIPVNMMQQQPQEQEAVPQIDENRPHFLQPRSVVVEEPKSRVARSVNNPLLPEKRLKRCACDCAC